MKQSSLIGNVDEAHAPPGSSSTRWTRVVPWSDLVAQIAPFMPEGKRGRPPFPVESLLRIHFMQQWFTLSDPAMEEALHDMPLFRDFAGLGGWDDRLPDESTICDSAMCWRSTSWPGANPGNRQFAAGCQA